MQCWLVFFLIFPILGICREATVSQVCLLLHGVGFQASLKFGEQLYNNSTGKCLLTLLRTRIVLASHKCEICVYSHAERFLCVDLRILDAVFMHILTSSPFLLSSPLINESAEFEISPLLENVVSVFCLLFLGMTLTSLVKVFEMCCTP